MSSASKVVRVACLAALAALMLGAAPAARQEPPANSAEQIVSPEPYAPAGETAASSPDRNAGGIALPQPGSGGDATVMNDIANSYATDEDSTSIDEASGFLGRYWPIDVLLLFAAGLLGGLIAWPIAMRQAREASLERINGKLKRIEEAVGRLRQENASATAGESSRSPSLDTRRANYVSASDQGQDGFGSARAASLSPSSAPRDSSEEERRNRMGRAVAEYGSLVAAKGAKPRQFADLLRQFPAVRALQLDRSGGIAATAYSGDDPNQLVVAAGDGREFDVLPSYDYVFNFVTAFSPPVQNPEIMRQLFDLQIDDSGQLRMVRPAKVSIDETGRVDLRQRGRLAGFTS